MYRTIWSYYFITGLLSLTAGVPVMDDWASALIALNSPGTCRLAAQVSEWTRADLSICVAALLGEARDLAGNGWDVLAGAHHDMPLVGWIRVADVVVIAIGVLGVAVALVWGWANAMTRLAGLSMTGTYTLLRAIGIVLARRGFTA